MWIVLGDDNKDIDSDDNKNDNDVMRGTICDDHEFEVDVNMRWYWLC